MNRFLGLVRHEGGLLFVLSGEQFLAAEGRLVVVTDASDDGGLLPAERVL